jgi:dipeptidyl aminopeptidase/acylaminoacyl peptidase
MTALAPDELFAGSSELQGFAPRFRGVVSYFPATTFIVPEVLAGSNFENPNRFATFLGGPYDQNKELAKQLSPVEYLSPDGPPVLLLHGDKDEVLSLRNSTYMMEVAKQTGADVQLVTVTNGMHGFKGFAGQAVQPSTPEINRIAADFIIKNLTAQ